MQFFTPHTLTNALDLLDQHREKTVIINGGTDIVEQISKGTVSPEAIIYIQDMAELKEMRQEDGYTVIGSAVTYKEMEQSALCRKYSALMDCLSSLGSPAIKNVGTPAGNIGTAAAAGDCNVALIALGAQVVLESKHGKRTIAIEDIFSGKGKTKINPDELIREIKLPLAHANTRSSFIKLARRKAQDIGKVLVAVSLTLEGDICREARIAAGAIGPAPLRLSSLEQLMVGNDIVAGLAKIKDVFPQEAKLRDSRFRVYKEQVVSVIVRRALEKAVGGEYYG